MFDHNLPITDPQYPLLPDWELQTGDAQRVAEDILRRKLDESELMLLPSCYEPSCSCETWDLTMENAIYSIVA